MYLPMLALAIAAFGIGTTEYVIMGLLPEVAASLQVSVKSAGMLISGYALGVAVGAPLLAIATARWPRRFALLCLVGLFTLGNALCALAPNYDLLMVARVVTAFCHAAFFGIGSVVAADLVPREKRAQAIALVFTGLTVANVLGVPMGTALGQWCGWRATFWCVTAIGLLALICLQLWLPKKIVSVASESIYREFRSLLNPQVQIALLISTVFAISLFSVFTYIAYILRDVAGFSAGAVSWTLLLFGAGITAGGLLGGRLADWKQLTSLAGLFLAICVVMVQFVFSCHHQLATLLTLFVWGLVSFAVVPGTQMRVMDKAVRAPNLASTLNQGAFNLGNAIGAWLGGLMIDGGGKLSHLPWMGAILAFIGFLIVLVAGILERKMKRIQPVSPA